MKLFQYNKYIISIVDTDGLAGALAPGHQVYLCWVRIHAF